MTDHCETCHTTPCQGKCKYCYDCAKGQAYCCNFCREQLESDTRKDVIFKLHNIFDKHVSSDCGFWENCGRYYIDTMTSINNDALHRLKLTGLRITNMRINDYATGIQVRFEE